jgi:predicted DNA-binding transcriptional regulator AlpA
MAIFSLSEPQERLVCFPEVSKRTGLPEETLRRREHAGRSRKRQRIGARAAGWLESEIDAWTLIPLRGVLPPVTNRSALP